MSTYTITEAAARAFVRALDQSSPDDLRKVAAILGSEARNALHLPMGHRTMARIVARALRSAAGA
jgi:hypothetical protein